MNNRLLYRKSTIASSITYKINIIISKVFQDLIDIIIIIIIIIIFRINIIILKKLNYNSRL